MPDPRDELLQLLVTTPGIFSFFSPGEERKLAHHDSHRKPEIVYAGAEKSPYFCNMRPVNNAGGKKGVVTAEMLNLMGTCLFSLAQNKLASHDAIAGIPNAGDHIVTAIIQAAHEQMQLINVRFRKSEDTGGRSFLRFELVEHLIRAVFDDVITLADVKLRFFKALEPNFGTKPALYVLIDRMEGGTEILRRLGYEVHALFTLDEVLTSCLIHGIITVDQAGRIRDYAARRRALIANHMGEILDDLTKNPNT